MPGWAGQSPGLGWAITGVRLNLCRHQVPSRCCRYRGSRAGEQQRGLSSGNWPGLPRHEQAAFSSGAGRKETQSLHGKCLRRTKAARVKSDSGNRRLTPSTGAGPCASLLLPALRFSCLHFAAPACSPPVCPCRAAPGCAAHTLCSLTNHPLLPLLLFSLPSLPIWPAALLE